MRRRVAVAIFLGVAHDALRRPGTLLRILALLLLSSYLGKQLARIPSVTELLPILAIGFATYASATFWETGLVQDRKAGMLEQYMACV